MTCVAWLAALIVPELCFQPHSPSDTVHGGRLVVVHLLAAVRCVFLVWSLQLQAHHTPSRRLTNSVFLFLCGLC
jgi:hypothetical protein